MMNLETAEQEAEMLASYERGEWQSVSLLQQELQRYQEYAEAMLGKGRQVSVHLATQDFERIREQAAEAGMSYQAFIANIVHQFVSGQLVEPPHAQ